ncbi:hypothetical protein E4U13_007974 [Claviceps humidiphila]|uniref:SAM-dependent MTase RsmB/NOP-type domain-containing protein n=1 Tax=Claviceps humidiphila TaxID=1294629 RepID=A0A9P7Q4K4_9HYPO|nr:hypothetical protein E4U13_007974 [Claviceps humidiphila]
MSLYHEAADILSTSTNTPHPSSEGGSLKARVFGRKNLKSPPSQLYALVLETCKWSGVLKEVIERAELLRHERKLTPLLALLLVHDLLLAKGGIALPQSHGLRSSIDRHKARLSSEFTRARLRRKAPSVEALRGQVHQATAGEEASYPRWVRVNALLSTVEEQLATTFRAYQKVDTIREVVASATATAGDDRRRVFLDPHVPNLLAITPGSDLSKTEAYTSGKIILQDKASCFPAYLLDPRPQDGDVVDACAAPGNKTTHLASILHGHSLSNGDCAPSKEQQSTIFAFEKDTRRAQTLQKMVRIAGAKDMIRIAAGQDFLQVNVQDAVYKNVSALLLDPSCSGSGIVGRDSMPPLHLPEFPTSSSFSSSSSSSPSSSAQQKKKKPPREDPSYQRKRKLDQVADTQSPNRTLLRDDDGNETVLDSEKDLHERLQALSSFQLTLLLHAFRFPSATKVTYSTCSVHRQENEHVVMKALQSGVARARGWRILRREDQVAGMQAWPVRGLVDACEGDESVAEGCIRTYKDDGHGVMGFFVAAFVRDAGSGVVVGEKGPCGLGEDGGGAGHDVGHGDGDVRDGDGEDAGSDWSGFED